MIGFTHDAEIRLLERYVLANTAVLNEITDEIDRRKLLTADKVMRERLAAIRPKKENV